MLRAASNKHPTWLLLKLSFGVARGEVSYGFIWFDMAVCQNLVPLVNIKIAGKWMFIPLKMVLIGIDPYPYGLILTK